MMKVLAYIIENPGVTIDDIAVAVSLALQNGENLKAYVWADAAIKKYPDSPVISALYLTSMRTVGRADDARIYLDTLS